MDCLWWDGNDIGLLGPRGGKGYQYRQGCPLFRVGNVCRGSRYMPCVREEDDNEGCREGKLPRQMGFCCLPQGVVCRECQDN